MTRYEDGLTLGEVIAALAPHVGKRASLGFCGTHSYRGYYECLAFGLASDVEVDEMLSSSCGAIGKTFTGWKGGEYRMTEATECYLADAGTTGWPLNAKVMALIVESIQS